MRKDKAVVENLDNGELSPWRHSPAYKLILPLGLTRPPSARPYALSRDAALQGCASTRGLGNGV